MTSLAPLKLADSSWDNVGLLIQSPKNLRPARVMLTVDLTLPVCEEAISQNVGFIVAYHPILFRPFKRITLEDSIQKIASLCIANGIDVFCPHTALDACYYGINDWLVGLLGPCDKVLPIQKAPAEQDERLGMGRIATLKKETKLGDVITNIKESLGLSHIRLALANGSSLGSLVKKVAVCAGSGASVFQKLEEPVDLFLTGEMSHHEVLAAVSKGISVILCEHTNTERGYLKSYLLEKLKNELEGVEVVYSTQDQEPIRIY